METIVALYDNIAHAQQVAERLVGSGVAPDDVFLIKQEAERTFQQIKEQSRVGDEDSELKTALDEVEIPSKHASGTAEEVEQGGGMIAVRVEERTRDRAMKAIEQYGLVDVAALRGKDSAAILRRATGAVAGGDFWINIEAAFKRHFQTRYAPKGFEFETYEPGYRFGYMLSREATAGSGDWGAAQQEIKECWQAHQRGEWTQFADAVQHGWYVGQGREPGRDLDVSEIQSTVRGAQYGELLEEEQND